ncbi:MAG: helix-turn-helix transcriptional regulator [Ruminococcaceae bacterium]|nr:helix-turn-helix transcriptional regulator [Oscillospiraceae bacterium]
MNSKSNIGERIAYYRRLNAMTQEKLAQKLNVSTQAVSKWEQKITSPDIMLLPELASIFNISIDELFGMKIDTEPVFNLVDNVPWDDDRQIRFAVYHGKKLMQQSVYELQDGINEINIHFDYGDVYKIHGICKLNV